MKQTLSCPHPNAVDLFDLPTHNRFDAKVGVYTACTDCILGMMADRHTFAAAPALALIRAEKPVPGGAWSVGDFFIEARVLRHRHPSIIHPSPMQETSIPPA